MINNYVVSGLHSFLMHSTSVGHLSIGELMMGNQIEPIIIFLKNQFQCMSKILNYLQVSDIFSKKRGWSGKFIQCKGTKFPILGSISKLICYCEKRNSESVFKKVLFLPPNFKMMVIAYLISLFCFERTIAQ